MSQCSGCGQYENTTEEDFQLDVIAYLENQRHKIIEIKKETKCDEFSRRFDVLSEIDGDRYITEVKRSLGEHRLETAIGQLVLHKFGRTDVNGYQIAFPKKCKECSRSFRIHFSDELSEYLYEFSTDIDIIFVDKQ